MRVAQPRGTRGSLKWTQSLIADHAELLESALRDEGALRTGAAIRWLSPRRDDDMAEYRDGAFLERIGRPDLQAALREFWPSGGPQWDALGRSDDGTVFLVEAKARAPELASSCTAVAPASLELIQRSLRETRAALGASHEADWSNGYYQYANRLAHLRFLRDNGVQAYLVFVYFVGDTEMRGPATRAEWKPAIDAAHRHLGFTNASKIANMIDVFVDVAQLDIPEIAPIGVEHHPSDYDYSKRFPTSNVVFQGEGGTAYAVEGAEGHGLASDEGAMTDVLGNSAGAVTIRMFGSRADRDALAAKHYPTQTKETSAVRDSTGQAPTPVEITVPTVLIRIRQVYRANMSAEALYEWTRAAWVMGPRREGARYAMPVSDGIVREVYEIDGWHPAGTTEYRLRPLTEVVVPGRWEFTGHLAPDAIRHEYVGRSVAATWARGAANPITYVNC
jgi:hypothetical protein